MTNKRQCIDGFSPQTTPIRIKKLTEWAPSGKWRDFDVVTVQYTYLRRVYLSPMGMIKELFATLIHYVI